MFQLIVFLALTVTQARSHSLEATFAGFLPKPVAGVAAAYDGKDSIMLMGFGRRVSTASETKILKYNVNTEVIEEVGGVPFLRFMGAVGIDQKRNVYYIGGNDGDYSSYHNILKFNSTHPNPVEVASLPVPLNQFSAASDQAGDVIYTFGGYDAQARGSSPRMFKFNTQENLVEGIGDLPESLYGSAAVWHNGFGYVMGGRNTFTGTGLTHVLKFDPTTNKVTELDMKLQKPTGLFLPSAVSDGRNVYLIGGNTHDRNSTHQITQMDFESDTLSEIEVANFPKMLVWSTAVYVPKKRTIYTFGGVADGQITDRIYKINLQF